MGNALRPAADRGELGESEFWAAVLQRNGVEARPGDLEFASYLEADGDLLTLARAAAREVRIGILSNDSREMARARRLRFGFDRWFAPIIISSDLGLIKPEPGIYLHALKAAACAPPQCLFIDDRPENIAGAQAVGMQTHLFRGLDLLRKELEDRGIL